MRLDRYRPGDEAALADVCIRTGDSGQDATGQYAHPELLHLIYLDPYLALEPSLAHVVRDDDGTACGYIVGCADSQGFEAACEASWWPPLREAWQPGTTPEGMKGEALIAKIHTPDRTPDELQAEYPAHLHIDLLPQAQGGGRGRALMERFLADLRERDVPGVHLGVGARNENAQGFYRHLGFEVLMDQPWGKVMGLRLA